MNETEISDARTDIRNGYTATHDWRSQRGISGTLLQVLMEVPGISVYDDAPLYEHIDPDAIDRLARHNDELTFTVSFEYQDHEIEIRSGGDIHVRPLLP